MAMRIPTVIRILRALGAGEWNFIPGPVVGSEEIPAGKIAIASDQPQGWFVGPNLKEDDYGN